MPTQPDSRQVKKRSALPKLGTPANSTVETILDKVNIEVDSPLRLAASTTPDALINFTATLISAADSANKVVSPVKKQIFSTLAASTINFQTQAVSNAAYFDIAFPTPNVVGRFRYAGFTLIGSGKIKVLFSAEATSEALLSNPGALFVSGGLPIGYVALECTDVLGYFKTAGSATNIIENAKIYRLAAGGGSSSSGGSASGGGGELVDLLFNIDYRDSFANIPDGTTTVDIAAGTTDATLHDVANELFRISYDASKTITAVGTAVTISAPPSFTVKIGDIINVPGTDSPKKITAVASQTSVTVESAWTVNPSAAACNISQAIHTQDLNAFTAGGLGLAASSQYTGNIDEIMVGYEDTTTVGDIIPDFGTAPVIAFAASSDNTNWTIATSRVTSLSQQELAVALPTSSTQMRLRFFSNATSGSGAVNLLGYKVFFHKQTGSQIGSSYNTAFARPTSALYQNVSHSVVGGKSRFQFSFGYPRGLNSGEASGSALEVYANGQRVPRFVSGITPTTEAYFTEDSGSVITMDTDYSTAGIDFQFMVKTPVIDSSTNNTSLLADQGDILDQKFDAEVISSTMTAINGTPSANQFRSDIVGRASIPHLANTLAVLVGPQTIMTQDIYQVFSESSLTGQAVWGTPNDKFNQLRFVGNWVLGNDTNGPRVVAGAITDYMEVVFNGTTLNVLTLLDTNARDLRTSIDGGAELANPIGTGYSGILNTRNYAQAQIVTLVSGLTPGVHTARIRINAVGANTHIYGFQIINDITSLRVMSGAATIGRYKNISTAIQTVAYASGFESGTLTTTGGRGLVYLKNDQTINKSVTPNATPLYLAATNHTNEEMVRKFNILEFGAGRADDFTTLGAAGTRGYTLDDNIHTLVGNLARKPAAIPAAVGAVELAANNSYLSFTFEGTGCDVLIAEDAALGSSTSLIVDGVNQGFIPSSIGSSFIKMPLVSGLSNGTHTVKLLRGTVSNAIAIADFIVYAPKKPALPVGAVELGEFNIRANITPITSLGATIAASLGVIGSGYQRNANTRSAVYNGTWIAQVDAVFNSGFYIASSVAASYVEYTFFGSAITFIGLANAAAINATFAIDGVTNLSGFTTSLVQTSTGATFTASTGVLSGTPAAQCKFAVNVSGLTPGRHVIRITQNNTNTFYVDCFDVANLIASTNSNIPSEIQNTLTTLPNGVSDSRKFNKRDVINQTIPNYAKAVGIVSGPTTSSVGLVPLPDLSVTVRTNGRPLDISAYVAFTNSTNGAGNKFAIFVNGIQVTADTDVNTPTAALVSTWTNSILIPVSAGIHKVDVYWGVFSGTITGFQVSRNLTVKELGSN